MLNDADLVHEMLGTRHGDFLKSRVIRAQAPLLGNGLLLNEGDDWRAQRRLAEPAFNRGPVSDYTSTFVECGAASAGACRRGRCSICTMPPRR